MAQGAPPLPPPAEMVAKSARPAATATTLSISAGTLAQPITFDVTVRAPAAAGSPQGLVYLLDHGVVEETLTLSPTNSANPKFAYSVATFTITPQPGGSAFFFGSHPVTAEFAPGSNYLKSSASKSFTVREPSYVTLTGGVKVATIASGSGPAIQSGQTASVLYTGYLARNGEIFDDSIKDGGEPLTFMLGSAELISGFNTGVVGMQVGETRIVEIPPAEAYGDAKGAPVPPNSTLIFVITLESIL